MVILNHALNQSTLPCSPDMAEQGQDPIYEAGQSYITAA